MGPVVESKQYHYCDECLRTRAAYVFLYVSYTHLAKTEPRNTDDTVIGATIGATAPQALTMLQHLQSYDTVNVIEAHYTTTCRLLFPRTTWELVDSFTGRKIAALKPGEVRSLIHV